jgi:HEPN domain-containing protein
MSAPDAIRASALAALRTARVDLNVAKLAFRARDEVDPWVACFHAQQAVEKAIKAVLIARQVDYPKIHDLPRLLLPTGDDIPLAPEDAAWLTVFATTHRYDFADPTPGSEPDWEDVERAIASADSVLDAVARHAEGDAWDSRYRRAR